MSQCFHEFERGICDVFFFFFSLLSVFGYKLTRVLICLLLQARSADTQAEPAERKTPQFIV